MKTNRHCISCCCAYVTKSSINVSGSSKCSLKHSDELCWCRNATSNCVIVETQPPVVLLLSPEPCCRDVVVVRNSCENCWRRFKVITDEKMACEG